MPHELDLAINDGTLVLPGGPVAANLGVRDGVIAAISREPLEAVETLDAGGRIVLPGGIDPHVQLHNKGGILPGYDADVVVVDPNKEVMMSRDILHSRCDYTPYEGRYLHGYPVATVSRGEIVMRDGAFTGGSGRGRLVKRGVPAVSDRPRATAR